MHGEAMNGSRRSKERASRGAFTQALCPRTSTRAMELTFNDAASQRGRP